MILLFIFFSYRFFLLYSLVDALNSCTNLSLTSINLFVKLCMLCLDNTIIKFQDTYYQQKTGIVTGENNSVSLANISLHFVVKQNEIVKQAKLFKRFIDDVVYVSENRKDAECIQESLRKGFEKYNLELTFKTISTKDSNKQIEFLDILHVSDPESCKGFYVTNFVKPTAKERTFLNGNSYHPISVFKSVYIGEAIRMRRLNDRDDQYLKSIEELEHKCIRSNFNENIIKQETEKVKLWTNNVMDTNKIKSNNKQKEKKKRITWCTQFKKFCKLNKLESSLSPDTSVTFCKPPNLGMQLLNYKKISQESVKEKSQRKEQKCKKTKSSRCMGCASAEIIKITKIWL